MANATQAMSTITAILKEVYEDRLVSQLQDEVVAMKRIERTSDGVTSRTGGKYVDFPIVVQRNQGISYRSESEQLGDAGKSAYSEVHVDLKYGYGRVEVTGQLIELADGNPKSFANAFDKEMELLKDAIAKDESRIFYGDGTGLISGIRTTASSTSVAVEDAYWFETGQKVDILVITTGATITNGSGLTITDVNYDTNTITVSASVSVTAGTHGVYRAGNFAAGQTREPEGLKSIVKDSGTLYGVDPAAVPKWKAKVTNLAGALSESAMIKMMDDLRTNGGIPSVMFTTLGVRRAYFNLLTQQRRFTDVKKFEGGLNGLAFSYGAKEIPLVEDPDLRPDYSGGTYTGRIYFLREKDFKIYQSRDWHWVDRDGSVLKWVTNYDKYEALIQRYWQVGISRRNTQGMLTGITEN